MSTEKREGETVLEREARERFEERKWKEKNLSEKIGYKPEAWSVHGMPAKVTHDGCSEEEWDAMPLHERLGYAKKAGEPGGDHDDNG